MTVEFSLLGDIEARIDGRRLDIGHARQRCVLLAFLIDVNRPIPVDQLVDRVWSDRPPNHARNSLAGYVSRLRNLLADTEDACISREPGGYVLTADPLSVDLHRFRSVVSQARASADPREAAALFDGALEIWSDEPFVALDTPWVNDVRSALEAERFSVHLDRNDAALRVGRHAELLVELSATQAARPLDERLAGQLMLALYRNGRQADALDTYRRIRERLVEELGVDPGSALRQVHQQILTGEAEQPTANKAAVPHSTPAHPRAFERSHSGLLRRATSFVGHERELGQVTDALRTGPLVTLTGVGGVGKTRLALEVARREQERFADGVWICELGPLEHDDAVVHTVAASVWLRQQQGMDIEKSVIEYLRVREVLLVFDNCEHVVEAAARLIEQIVQHCPRVSVLATSRQPLGVEGERIVGVPPLRVEDATRLFADRARASRPDFTLDDQPAGAVAEICRRVDCLPLGVELAAARMRVMSSLDVARRPDYLVLLRGGARSALPRQRSLAETIAWSYRLLTEHEQLLFARISAFAGCFDLEAAHGVCGADGASEADTLELLTRLVDKSMVVVRTVDDRTRYSFLETLRAYGRERLQENGISDQLAMRHAVYFTELAERAGAAMHTAQEREWVERMLPDYDNLRAAFEHAMDEGNVGLALRLVAAVPELIGWRIGFEVAEWAERVIAVADPDHPLFPAAVGVAARVAWNHADFERAKSLAALAQGRVPGRGSARVVYPADVMADVALFEGEPLKALAYWEAEVARARREADPMRLGWGLFVVAICQGVMRNDDIAAPVAQEAVEVAERTGNPTAQSMAYFSLGYLLRKSEPERALALFDDAARLAADVQNFWVYGSALMQAASIRALYGDPGAAAQMFISVLEHWDRFGDMTEQWLALRYVARLLIRLGGHEDAAFLYWSFVSAGKPCPLTAAQMDVLVDSLGPARLDALRVPPISNAEVIARARTSLQWHYEHAAVPVS
ncbi:BTAD domain-containing putative transcriptional regulator [Mycobacterium riyadhense]|uniref:Transcriptional regulator n=1 Tax=Mycobacterium riyadhense TaxID=486698 RepID=A0A1X2DGI1_9MYCO|nr:BTAD domain-containing putative transcriptional regulator [Mycobacterium riyadhense]MCV7147867.1 AfsR/SARP family transcriptional regulator [Mycobacterium riyadhense]ORW87226.1 transcriptional regulator [Mycobacterium riyadhense]